MLFIRMIRLGRLVQEIKNKRAKWPLGRVSLGPLAGKSSGWTCENGAPQQAGIDLSECLGSDQAQRSQWPEWSLLVTTAVYVGFYTLWQGGRQPAEDPGAAQEGAAITHFSCTACARPALHSLPGQHRHLLEPCQSNELWAHQLTRVRSGWAPTSTWLWSPGDERCFCSPFLFLPVPAEFSSRGQKGMMGSAHPPAQCWVKAGASHQSLRGSADNAAGGSTSCPLKARGVFIPSLGFCSGHPSL